MKYVSNAFSLGMLKEDCNLTVTEINPLKKIKVYRRMLKEYKKDINELMDNIIELCDLEVNND